MGVAAVLVALMVGCNARDPVAPFGTVGNTTTLNNATTGSNNGETNSELSCVMGSIELGETVDTTGCTELAFVLDVATSIRLTFTVDVAQSFELLDDGDALVVGGDVEGGTPFTLDRVLDAGAFVLRFGDGTSTAEGTVSLEASDCAAPTPLSFSAELADGVLEEGDCVADGFYDEFTVTFEERTSLFVQARSDVFSPEISVTSATGELVVTEVESALARVGPGEYLVRISGGEGAYRVGGEIRQADCESDGVLALDRPFRGALEFNDCDSNTELGLGGIDARADVYTIEVEQAGYHRIDVKVAPGDASDLALALYKDGSELEVSLDSIGTEPAIASDLAVGLYTVILASEDSQLASYDIAFTRAASPACRDNGSTLRVDLPATRTGTVWNCQGGIIDYPIYDVPGGARSIRVSSPFAATVEVLRNDGADSTAFGSCDADPDCTFDATFAPGVTWLRISGAPGGGNFTVTVE